MKELSLNILDIAENSFKANASLVRILLTETEDELCIEILDDGTGMTAQTVQSVENPFFTTRTTRSVGMGIPLFKLEAEQTGGSLAIESRYFEEYPEDHGTAVTAVFKKQHIDYTPLGDVISTVVTLIQGHPDVELVFRHSIGEGKTVGLDTRELRSVLGDVPLDTPEVIKWIKEYLLEQYSQDNPD